MSGFTGQQFPPEAIGAAVGVFLYSFICFSLSSALLWATIAHREWKSYVALLAFFPSLSALVSMAQQLHTYLRWASIKFAQSEYVKANDGNPELSVAGPSVGVDLILFYIQYYCYNVEALLVLVWSFQLAQSVFQMKASPSAARHGSNTAKLMAILIPVLQVTLMRTKVVQSSLMGFYFVANFIMAMSLALGSIFLMAILVRYISTRTEVSWRVNYADRSHVDQEAQNSDSLASFASTGGVPRSQRSIYDNWLVVRFAVAFAGLAIYELVIIMAEISFAIGTDEIAADERVDLRPSNAIADCKSFLPGVSASILAFVVFGTTRTFRAFFYRKLVPRPIRRKLRRRTKNTSPAAEPPPEGQQPRRPSRAAAPPIGSALSTPHVDCFELDGGEAGMRQGRDLEGGLYELAVPTPMSSTFAPQKVDHGVIGEDEWPMLSIRPPK